jgi:hypothetical protein
MASCSMLQGKQFACLAFQTSHPGCYLITKLADQLLLVCNSRITLKSANCYMNDQRSFKLFNTQHKGVGPHIYKMNDTGMVHVLRVKFVSFQNNLQSRESHISSALKWNACKLRITWKRLSATVRMLGALYIVSCLCAFTYELQLHYIGQWPKC